MVLLHSNHSKTISVDLLEFVEVQLAEAKQLAVPEDLLHVDHRLGSSCYPQLGDLHGLKIRQVYFRIRFGQLGETVAGRLQVAFCWLRTAPVALLEAGC
jgi:hypothetical protein